MIAPMFLYATDKLGNQVVIAERFTIVGIVFSVLGLICHLLCYSLSTERVKVDVLNKQENAPKQSFFGLMKSLVQNKSISFFNIINYISISSFNINNCIT